MIKKVMDVKLNVKPVFVMFAHRYYYEGPCRMAGGDALQPGFDTKVNGAIFNGTMEGVNSAFIISLKKFIKCGSNHTHSVRALL